MAVTKTTRECDEIQPGRALVLVGPQGCGKETLARALAKRVGGSIDQTDAAYLTAWHHLAFHASGRDVLIISGWPRMLDRPMNWGELKALIAASLRPQSIRVPHLVFCLTPDELPLKVVESSRFHVVHLPMPRH